jgi:hypothetical protein
MSDEREAGDPRAWVTETCLASRQDCPAQLLEDIAKTGSPRCCKRDSRIAVSEAVPVFKRDFGLQMKELAESPTCWVMDANSVCMGRACPYHPDHS